MYHASSALTAPSTYACTFIRNFCSSPSGSAHSASFIPLIFSISSTHASAVASGGVVAEPLASSRSRISFLYPHTRGYNPGPPALRNALTNASDCKEASSPDGVSSVNPAVLPVRAAAPAIVVPETLDTDRNILSSVMYRTSLAGKIPACTHPKNSRNSTRRFCTCPAAPTALPVSSSISLPNSNVRKSGYAFSADSTCTAALTSFSLSGASTTDDTASLAYFDMFTLLRSSRMPCADASDNVFSLRVTAAHFFIDESRRLRFPPARLGPC